MANSLQLSDILNRLDCRRAGRGYRAVCPAHGGDNKTALAIQEGEDGKVLLHCHAHGCTYEDILRSLGLWQDDMTSHSDRKTGRTRPPKPAKLTEDERPNMARTDSVG
jgi:hypothetical protein